MINFKPKVYEALQSITVNVSDVYPKGDKWTYPVIVYEDENNTPHTHTVSGERLSELRFRVEIHNGANKTTDLMLDVDSAMTSLGFRRTFNRETTNPKGEKFRTMRYEAVIDLQTEIIY